MNMMTNKPELVSDENDIQEKVRSRRYHDVKYDAGHVFKVT